MKSLALRMAAGSQVFLVVLTVMEPSIKSSVQAMPMSLSSFVTSGHAANKRVSTSEIIDKVGLSCNKLAAHTFFEVDFSVLRK